MNRSYYQLGPSNSFNIQSATEPSHTTPTTVIAILLEAPEWRVTKDGHERFQSDFQLD
jgi:hypothetical protein